MQDQQTDPSYQVWGTDNIAYGPFELPGLVTLVKQRRVTGDSWVFLRHDRKWVAAKSLAELKMFFEAKPSAASQPTARDTVKAENLRRIKVFAEMGHDQLESLLSYMQVVKVPKFTKLFSKGDVGDAMYSILEGEMRAALQVDGREATLFTMGSGESFGEIALLVQSTRSSDILANEESTLLKLPAEAFNKVTTEAPALATPFLLAISRMITNRALDLGRKYESAIRSARAVAEMNF
ncbi:MAG: cyclic nucleotide-binding domain-containing protein [Limisphaerales bacterium]